MREFPVAKPDRKKVGRPTRLKRGAMTNAEYCKRYRARLKREQPDSKTERKKQRRAEREAALASKVNALPERRYSVIVADPEWRFEVYRRDSGLDRGADNHYPTSPIEVILARDVPSIAADAALLALWATVPMLEQAFVVIARWGFYYKSMLTWDKVMPGTGYWFRNQTEHLLIATRGDFPAPGPGQQLSSLWRELKTTHSTKPGAILDWLDHLYPNLPKIELNRRGPARPNWDAWGNETEEPDEDLREA